MNQGGGMGGGMGGGAGMGGMNPMMAMNPMMGMNPMMMGMADGMVSYLSTMQLLGAGASSDPLSFCRCACIQCLIQMRCIYSQQHLH
jgi:hypothetical protein